jgi:pimeloyl-ACP methyl ester carboxylesterase
MVWEPEVLHVDGPLGLVPATLFISRDVVAGAPIILLGHGAHTSKDDPTMQMLARALARGIGAGVATLDCPGHGERRPAGLDEAGFDALVQANMTDPAVFDQLAMEWPLVLAAARARDQRLTGATAYAGFSMGSIFGFGLVSRLPDVRVVLLAVGGLLDEDAVDPAAAKRNRARNHIIRDGATRFGDRDVLMTNMTRDEHFPIAGAIEVFTLLPGPKRMVIWEGTHEQLPAEAMTMAIDFLRPRIAP